MKFSPLPLAAAALSALALTTPALAQHETSRVVEFERSALESERGQAAIERQIHDAARSICDVRGQREAAQLQRARACYDAAVEQAMRDLDARVEARLNTRLAETGDRRNADQS